MRRVAILQARSNSSRLPGKVLLPVGGIPLAVLAARRAGNNGCDVLVATSKEPTDDCLADTIESEGIRCYRGDLDNTLDRVVSALADYEDDTCVFRLTADNVFPDGQLLDELYDEFIQQQLDYLCCNGDPSGLPYGVSVELTWLRHLRNALASTSEQHDLEHVTPWVRRQFGDTYFRRYQDLAKGHYRATVDCFDDYVAVQQVFREVPDPVNHPWMDLIKRLEGTRFQPVGRHRCSRLVVGTAQLGMDYGISNASGMPSLDAAETILKTAIGSGVGYIDTARAYGRSEEVIGRSLASGWLGRAPVITKLSPMAECPEEPSLEVVRAFVESSVFHSQACLRTARLDVLLLHRATHLHDWGGQVWSCLREMRAEGTIGTLGVSVQSPEELAASLSVPDVGLIQMPFHILDWRWDSLIPKIEKARADRGLVVHVRSSMLQGLLVADDPGLWRQAGEQRPEACIRWLRDAAHDHGCESVSELCIRYCLAQKWIDGVVIGMESLAQLKQNIVVFDKSGLGPEEVRLIKENRPMLAASTLDPAQWRREP